MRIRLQGPGHAASLLAELNRCRQSRQYCDVFLQVGNRTFAAHRAVLACSGTYFRNLFARSPASSASSASAFSLEFISAANFEKVLMFVYTGEIFTDLIDVGVLYELAERLGISELVRACHASFPDLQASVSANGKAGSSGDVTLDSSMVATAADHIGSVASVSACSSAASCSSLSSSAVPTPAAAPSPLLQPRTSRASHEVQTGAESLDLKVEDIRSHIGFGQMAAGGHSHSTASDSSQCDGVPPLRPALPLKTEQGDEEAEGSSEDGGQYGRTISVESAPLQSGACSFPDSSSQLGNKACDPPSPSGGPLCTLQVESLEGGVADVRGDGGLTFVDVEEGENGEQREAAVGAEEEQWRRLAGEIIELSDDENFMEEAEEEDDEDDLVCLENGEGGNSSGQLVTCDMCRSQFCSQNKLLRHHRQTASCYAIPPAALTNGGQGLSSELLCAVCSKSLSKDFQSLRDHLLSHVCLQTLRCGVCHLPQPSPCSLLWHALAHLSLPVFSCPHCACCFVERPLLDRHMAAHAEEAAAKEKELRVGADGAELQCFLCPQTFPSSSAFLYHLSLHTGEPQGGGGGPGALGRPGKRKADQPAECPPSSCSSSALREVGSLAKTSNPGPDLASGGVSNGSPWPDGGAGPAGVREKWYRCRYCGKRFAHSGEFTYHLRIHTGEKPYQCKVCLRFFRGRSTMICHLKTHAGALMYRCTVCGLYFSTLKLVSSHMELHKDHLPPDFNIEQTFMYSDHSKEPLPPVDT